MGFLSAIAALVVKGVKSLPKILASTVSGISSAVQTWQSYNTPRFFNEPRLFNGPDQIEDNITEEKQQFEKVLYDNLGESEAKTFLNTINNVISLKNDAEDKSPECQCTYALTQTSKVKNLKGGTLNVAVSSSSDANSEISKQNNAIYSCPFVTNLEIELNSVPTDSNVNISEVLTPQNLDDIDSYVKINTQKLNQNNTSTSTNMGLDAQVFQIDTVENEIIPLLKLSYNYKDNELDDFMKKISLIWGNHGGVKAFISKVLKSIKARFLDSVRSNGENAVKIDTNPDGTLDVSNFEPNQVDCIQLGTKAYLIGTEKDCSITMNQQTGSMVVSNNGFPFPKSLSEKFEFKSEPVRLSFIKKSELLELAKLYIKKDATFDKILLKLCYKYRHTSGLHAVFKKGELHRFVSTEQLNDLEDDEEYEENNVRFFFN